MLAVSRSMGGIYPVQTAGRTGSDPWVATTRRRLVKVDRWCSDMVYNFLLDVQALGFPGWYRPRSASSYFLLGVPWPKL